MRLKEKVSLLTPEQKRVTQKIIDMKYHKTWNFKYKQKHFLLHHLSLLCLEAGAYVLVQCLLFAMLVEYTIRDCRFQEQRAMQKLRVQQKKIASTVKHKWNIKHLQMSQNWS